MRIYGLILAKKDSRRLPNKNTLDFHGIPMFLVNVIKCVKIFDKVYVSSDDDDILDWADSRGAIGIKRPAELCGDVPNIPVYQHVVQFMGDVEAIVAVQANSPNVSSEIIEDVKYAIEDYDEVITTDKEAKIYGSVWGIQIPKLMSYKETYDYYNPTPRYKIKDLSIDIHTQKDYQKALQEHD
jgi:CMP-N-acetylneuraminic acid synthetase